MKDMNLKKYSSEPITVGDMVYNYNKEKNGLIVKVYSYDEYKKTMTKITTSIEDEKERQVFAIRYYSILNEFWSPKPEQVWFYDVLTKNNQYETWASPEITCLSKK